MKNPLITWPANFPIKEVTSHEIVRVFHETINPDKRSDLERNASILALIASKYLTAANDLVLELTSEAQRTERLEHLVELDQLTNLYLQVSFRQELVTSLWNDRRKHPNKLCALFFLDLVNFAKLNEEILGYRKADIVLTRMGTLIPEHIRSGGRRKDIHGRYGGDQFVGFIADISYKGIERVAQRIMQAIETHPWKMERGLEEDGEALVIRVHVGVAFCQQEVIEAVRKASKSMEKFEALFVHRFIDCAGQAVNESKREGHPIYKECSITIPS